MVNAKELKCSFFYLSQLKIFVNFPIQHVITGGPHDMSSGPMPHWQNVKSLLIFGLVSKVYLACARLVENLRTAIIIMPG